MILKVKKFLLDNNICNRNVLVGLSGGPDSVSLLFLLYQLKDEFNLNITAAYINHGIRSLNENLKDFELVSCHCKKLGVELFVLNIPQDELVNVSKKTVRSIEAVAREYRYNFFNKVLETNGLIALGHNKDDQLETMVMRFFQGSSLEGLIGIESYIDNVIRPLHNTSKSEILLFLEENRIKYNIDSSNLENDYLRNKVRNTLLPVISEIFPGFDRSLKKLEDDFRSYEQIINNAYPSVSWEVIGKLNYVIDFNKFVNLPFIIRKKEIYNLYDKVYKNIKKDFRLPSRFLLPLKDIDSHGMVVLEGYGYRLYRHKEKLYFTPNPVNRSFHINISTYGEYSNSKSKYNIINNKEGNLIFGLQFPFILRSPILGYKEIKKLKNMGINHREYDKITIVEKDSKVIAIFYESRLIYGKINSESNICIIIK